MPDPSKVRAMFARIAGRYDLLNRLLSAGIDQRWRRAAVKRAGAVEGKVLVDACCGTGDLALAFGERGARVVGVDFTTEMLTRAIEKDGAADLLFVGGDALRLPIGDGRADFSAVAFGIRNVADWKQGLAELARVVRPGGMVLVLEFGLPRGRLLGPLYSFYFTRVLPRIGGWIAGDRDAYRYLPDTVMEWPTPEAFRAGMEDAGLIECGHRALSGGIAGLFWGRVPEARAGGS